jgi:hypothetical protein
MRNEWRANRLWAAALALVLFLAGTASGFAISRLYGPRRHGPPDAAALLERYRGELGLTDEQARRIELVLGRLEREMSELFERIDPEARAIHARANAEVRAQLSGGQIERFDEMVAGFERRRAAMRQRIEAARRTQTNR